MLLLLQQNRKYKVAHIVAYLLLLDIAVRPSSEYSPVPETVGPLLGDDLIYAPIDANANAELYFRIYVFFGVMCFASIPCKQL
jgi:hypothetical protein